MIRLEYSQFITKVGQVRIGIQDIPRADGYELHAVGGDYHFFCICEGADATDYETNHQPTANTPLYPTKIGGVKDPGGMRARLVGIVNSTITAGTTQDLDWQMPQLQWPPGTNRKSYFDGIEYHCDGAIGDYCQFQVVDKDGLAYPAGTVLEEFGSNYYMVPSVLQDIILYKASIVPGMYLRLKYTSTGGSNVKLVANLFRHLDGNS